MELPESVRAYFTDGGIRRAVCQLVESSRAGTVFEGLEWEELGRFYEAQRAARQFESDWAVFGQRAWTEVWAVAMGGWTPLSPDEQSTSEHDAGLDLASLIDPDSQELWFGRVFTSASSTFYASLSAVPGIGLTIRASCVFRKRSVDLSALPAVMDLNGNWQSAASAALDVEMVDLAPLIAVATQAVDMVRNDAQ